MTVTVSGDIEVGGMGESGSRAPCQAGAQTNEDERGEPVLTEENLAEVLRERHVRREAVFQAARYYIAERLGYPNMVDLRSDLSIIDGELGDLLAEIAGNTQVLQDMALLVLTDAWAEPAERERVLRAVDGGSGKLPGADVMIIAVTCLYGLYLVARSGERRTETTVRDARGGFVTQTIERQGALAQLLGRFSPVAQPASPAGTPPVVDPLAVGPDDQVHSILHLDIQSSTKPIEPEKTARMEWLWSALFAALRGVGLSQNQVQSEGRGDGMQVVVPGQRRARPAHRPTLDP
jgi:hypothetical protein